MSNPEPEYIDMKESTAGEDWTMRYTADIVTPDEGGLLWYAFKIETEEDDERTVFYYGNNDADLGGKGKVSLEEPHRYQITVYKHAEVPEWYRNGIVYQIFPDRFSRDDDWRERCSKANEIIKAICALDSSAVSVYSS